MNLSGMSPLLGFAASILGGQSSAAPGGSCGASGANDPLAAVMGLTQDVDSLATSGPASGLASFFGGGAPAGSIGGLLG